MKAQKGDLIRVVAIEDSMGGYEIGDILEVIGEDEGDGIVTCKGGAFGILLYHSEYVIHRKAGEEAPTATFVTEGTDVLVTEPSQDVVNSPNHYTQGRVEVIDVIEDAVAGGDAFEAVCQANVLKYMLRYRHKNGVEDIKKAVWYANKLIEHLDAKTTE